MGKLKITTRPEFDAKFDAYPAAVRDKLEYLRALVIETAWEIPEITAIEETLKWGEPSFLTKTGSTLRIDWKPKTPDQYRMYFNCSTRLVETFRLVFGDTFDYDKNRALIFQIDEDIPVAVLKQCIKASLLYHLVKDDLTLGI